MLFSFRLATVSSQDVWERGRDLRGGVYSGQEDREGEDPVLYQVEGVSLPVSLCLVNSRPLQVLYCLRY